MIALNFFLLRRDLKIIRETSMQKISGREALFVIKDGILALIMPLIIVLGVVYEVFTPTESAVVAVFYAFFIGAFVFRKIKLSMTVKDFSGRG